MMTFSVDQIRKMKDNSDNIRNVSVITSNDSFKLPLITSLVSKASISLHSEEQKGEDLNTHMLPNTSLYYEYDTKLAGESNPYLINLLDSRVHTHFASEMVANLKVVDGVIVIVDCVEGISLKLE